MRSSSFCEKMEVVFFIDSAKLVLQVLQSKFCCKKLSWYFSGSGQVGSGRTMGTLIIELTQLNFKWNRQLELSLAIIQDILQIFLSIFIYKEGIESTFVFMLLIKLSFIMIENHLTNLLFSNIDFQYQIIWYCSATVKRPFYWGMW